MKIQFIGTGSISAFSNSASVLINDHILFDVPNGSLKAMIRQGVEITKIDTVIISHTHADHCFDVPFLLWYKKRNENIEKEEPVKIITDEVTRKTVETLIELSYFNSAKKAKKEWIDFKEINHLKLLDGLVVNNELMDHEGIKYANGYIIENEKLKIGLTGDTSFCSGVKNLASRVDVLISDMTLEIGDKSHMGINNILELLEEFPTLKIIPIHMYDKTREQAQKLQHENLILVNDGDILER